MSRFVVVDLDDEVALEAALQQHALTMGPDGQVESFRAALEEAGTLVEQVDDEELVDSHDPGTGRPLGHTRERWAGPWDER